jgi:cation:H+ antiporter
MIILGLVLLVVGAELLVRGAARLAAAAGVSPLVVGLTVVAFGTSSPELAVSVRAALGGQGALAVGNVVGSNIFNLLAVLGAAGVVSGVPVSPEALRFDIPVMTAVAAACLPIFLTGRVIARWEGALFLGCYGAYTAFLVLVATRHAALVPYGRVMLVIVLPLVVATIAASAWRDGRRRPGNGIPL